MAQLPKGGLVRGHNKPIMGVAGTYNYNFGMIAKCSDCMEYLPIYIEG